ncbi:MAG: hypothetical protein U0V02_21940 [Anaerolineales bacterium]
MKSETFSIVVVESQPLMLIALSAALSAEGICVLAEVTNPQLAIRAVEKFEPRLLLFSIGKSSLPDLERISAIRYEFPNVLILALVGGDFRGQERMALDYGAQSVLTKAAPRAELIAALRKLLKQESHAVVTTHTTLGVVTTP